MNRGILLVLALALAGCAGPEVTPEGTGPQPVDVETGPDTGAISGVVVDETISPIAGATVELVNTGLSMETGPDGLFAFEDLAPGFYVLNATATDYLEIQTTATVTAGQTAKPRVMLPADLSPKPYHQTQQFTGHMVLSDFYGVYIVTQELGNNELCDCIFEFSSDPGVTTAVLEGVWESSTPRAEEHDMYWEFWGTESGYATGVANWGISPTLWHIPASTWSGETDWSLQISSGEQPDVEQEFEGFVTFFYVEAAPSQWSFVAGDR